MTKLTRALALLAFAAAPAAPLAAQAAGSAPPAQAGLGEPSAGLVSGPMMGDRAPDFSLPWATAEGPGGAQWWSLTGHRGKVVVLAFYPKDFTSGCTAEMQTFRDQYSTMFGDGVEVVGISADSVETHVRWAQSLGLPFRLLSDPTQQVAKAWGSAGANGYNKRTVFVIDRRGKVTYTNRQFGALDPKAYKDLQDAVALAKKT
ncbi:MAG: peroxiredoxin [Gemmatimonadetes bacterium]|nr:peroxiredoxin [Gemmatimonadota bacterium]